MPCRRFRRHAPLFAISLRLFSLRRHYLLLFFAAIIIDGQFRWHFAAIFVSADAAADFHSFDARCARRRFAAAAITITGQLSSITPLIRIFSMPPIFAIFTSPFSFIQLFRHFALSSPAAISYLHDAAFIAALSYFQATPPCRYQRERCRFRFSAAVDA